MPLVIVTINSPENVIVLVSTLQTQINQEEMLTYNITQMKKYKNNRFFIDSP